MRTIYRKVDSIEATTKRLETHAERAADRLGRISSVQYDQWNRMRVIDENVREARATLVAHGERLDGIELNLQTVNLRLETIEGRLDRHDVRFDAIDHRFDGVDQRFDAVESKIDTVIEMLGKHKQA